MTKDELTDRLHGLQASSPFEQGANQREGEFQTVLQELEIYQIELEMQNSELRDSQQALEESQDRFVNLYDFAPMGYLTMNEQALIKEINLTAASLIGVERNQLLERSFAPWILSADLPLFRKHLKSCGCADEKVITNLHLVRRDKQVIPIELSSIPSKDPMTGILHCRTTITDLTERRRMEDSLREVVEQLKLERGMRERFVSALTHDLRTPLTAAKMNIQLLTRKSEDPVSRNRLAAQILKNIDRIDQMIQDLLDANRIRAGEKLSLNATEFDLTLLVEETLLELASVYGERFTLRAKKAVKGTWSRHRLKRVVENLVTNAVKYGDLEKPITVSVTQNSKRRAILTVQNFGNPIPKEEQSTLFQQFRRSSTAESGKQKGWGLGLTVVRGIVEAHGGEITFESNERDGTIFRAVLPI